MVELNRFQVYSYEMIASAGTGEGNVEPFARLARTKDAFPHKRAGRRFGTYVFGLRSDGRTIFDS